MGMEMKLTKACSPIVRGNAENVVISFVNFIWVFIYHTVMPIAYLHLLSLLRRQTSHRAIHLHSDLLWATSISSFLDSKPASFASLKISSQDLPYFRLPTSSQLKGLFSYYVVFPCAKMADELPSSILSCI